MEAHPGRRSANDITNDNRVNPEIRDPTTFLSRSGSAPGSGPVRGFSVCVLVAGPRASESLDEADATKRDYISVDTSLGMSRGIPGYPGGLPRGSAGEAGPVPPRPLPLAGSPAEDARTYYARATTGSELSIFAQKRRLL